MSHSQTRGTRQRVTPFATVMAPSIGPTLVVTHGIEQIMRPPGDDPQIIGDDGAQYNSSVLGDNGLTETIELRWLAQHVGEDATRDLMAEVASRATLLGESDHARLLRDCATAFRDVDDCDGVWLFAGPQTNSISVDVGDWTATVFFDTRHAARTWDPEAVFVELSWMGDGPGSTHTWTMRRGIDTGSLPPEALDVAITASAALDRCVESLATNRH